VSKVSAEKLFTNGCTLSKLMLLIKFGEQKNNIIFVLMKSYLKKVSESEVSTIDSDGVLMGQDNQVKYRLVLYKQEFIFLYKKLVSVLKDISEVDIKVFVALTFEVDMHNHVIKSDKMLADKLASQCGVAPRSVFNAISSLAKNKMLVRDLTYKNVYRIHPDFGWKGEQKDRPKEFMIILQQEFDMDDKTKEWETGSELVLKETRKLDDGTEYDIGANPVGRPKGKKI